MVRETTSESPEVNFDLADPHPDALIESLRSFGYTPSAAVADLVDNSITAGASTIKIQMHWDGEDSWLSILDDGSGMNKDELVSAMRAGSQHPSVKRADHDLGRWGLGLKTASFSACRSLTVVTKSKNEPKVSRRWNLDHVNKTKQWQLLHDPTEIAEQESRVLDDAEHGTLIVWELMDLLRASDDTEDATGRDHFFSTANEIEKHISMVFHRFMKNPQKIEFWLNESKLSPWDPFLQEQSATQIVAHEQLPSSPNVEVTAFVLPHVSKITPEIHSNGSGQRGWNAHQGLYIYRNRRMIVDGSWLDLPFKQEEHYKLARIMVDLPNSSDQTWKLDAKKSTVSIPAQVLPDLIRLARVTRSEAQAVFRHRTQQKSRNASNKFTSVWKVTSRQGGRPTYRLDRSHPILANLIDTTDRDVADLAITVIEQSLPVQQIWIDSSDHPDQDVKPFENVSNTKPVEVMNNVRNAFIDKNGDDLETATSRLVAMDVFRDHAHLLGID